MRLIKSLLLIVLFFTIVGAGAFVARHHLPQISTLQIAGNLAKLPKVPPQVGTFLSQAQQYLPKDFGVISPGKILGTENASPSANITPKEKQLLEEVRYNYCQQVIKDYENRFGEASTSSANMATDSSTASP